MAPFSIKILILQSCRSCRNCSFMASGCRSPPVCHEHSEGLETNMDLNGKPSTDNIVPDFSIGGNEYISAAARHAAWPSRCAKSETPANKQVEVKTVSFKKDNIPFAPGALLVYSRGLREKISIMAVLKI